MSKELNDRIAALEAEVERKERQRKAMEVCCTCVNFGSYGSAEYCIIECPDRIKAYDHMRAPESECQFTPSKWEPAFYDEQEAGR